MQLLTNVPPAEEGGTEWGWGASLPSNANEVPSRLRQPAAYGNELFTELQTARLAVDACMHALIPAGPLARRWSVWCSRAPEIGPTEERAPVPRPQRHQVSGP